MKRLSVRDRILASFGLILLIMIGIGGFAHWQLTTIERNAAAVETGAIPGLHRSSLIKDALAAHYLMVGNQFVEPDPKVKQRNEPLLANHQAKIDRLIVDYEQTVLTDADRRAFAKFQVAYADYRRTADEVLHDPVAMTDMQVVRERFLLRFEPKFQAAFRAIAELFTRDQQRATATLGQVDDMIISLLTAIAISFAIALAVASIAGYTLLRSITVPLARLSSLMDAMRQGDFTQRMEIDRQDELGNVAEGFNRMADEVMELVGQVQRSGIRVSTSMTEIAATSKQQQATATEVAATTTQIGATSREIAATSKELVRTINDVATVAEHAAELATSGQRSGPYGRDNGPGDGGRQLDQCQARGAEREGRRHQSGRDHNHKGRGPDQPAVAECGDRGGEGRRIWPRLCRRLVRDPPACRPDGGRDLRYRANGEGDSVGRFRGRDGNGQIFGGSPARAA
jgi:methyl-accepting chemotaxis protein WspA